MILECKYHSNSYFFEWTAVTEFCFDLIMVIEKIPAVKRNLTSKSIKENCEIIQKGMANKGAYEKFGVPKNTVSRGMKWRVFL